MKVVIGDRPTLRIGIDPSFTSTGVSIVKDGSLLKSYIVTHCRPKVKYTKIAKRYNNIFEYVNYCYSTLSDFPEADAELIKTQNIIEATKAIISIILLYKNQGYNIEVYMEGVAFSSRRTQSLVELGALNYNIRINLIKLGIPFHIITPSANKKAFTGNGVADKELMIKTFLMLNPSYRPLVGYIKMDDIADAFALATYRG